MGKPSGRKELSECRGTEGRRLGARIGVGHKNREVGGTLLLAASWGREVVFFLGDFEGCRPWG